MIICRSLIRINNDLIIYIYIPYKEGAFFSTLFACTLLSVWLLFVITLGVGLIIVFAKKEESKRNSNVRSGWLSLRCRRAWRRFGFLLIFRLLLLFLLLDLLTRWTRAPFFLLMLFCLLSLLYASLNSIIICFDLTWMNLN